MDPVDPSYLLPFSSVNLHGPHRKKNYFFYYSLFDYPYPIEQMMNLLIAVLLTSTSYGFNVGPFGASNFRNDKSRQSTLLDATKIGEFSLFFIFQNMLMFCKIAHCPGNLTFDKMKKVFFMARVQDQLQKLLN